MVSVHTFGKQTTTHRFLAEYLNQFRLRPIGDGHDNRLRAAGGLVILIPFKTLRACIPKSLAKCFLPLLFVAVVEFLDYPVETPFGNPGCFVLRDLHGKLADILAHCLSQQQTSPDSCCL